MAAPEGRRFGPNLGINDDLEIGESHRLTQLFSDFLPNPENRNLNIDALGRVFRGGLEAQISAVELKRVMDRYDTNNDNALGEIDFISCFRARYLTSTLQEKFNLENPGQNGMIHRDNAYNAIVSLGNALSREEFTLLMDHFPPTHGLVSFAKFAMFASEWALYLHNDDPIPLHRPLGWIEVVGIAHSLFGQLTTALMVFLPLSSSVQQKTLIPFLPQSQKTNRDDWKDLGLAVAAGTWALFYILSTRARGYLWSRTRGYLWFWLRIIKTRKNCDVVSLLGALATVTILMSYIDKRMIWLPLTTSVFAGFGISAMETLRA